MSSYLHPRGVGLIKVKSGILEGMKNTTGNKMQLEELAGKSVKPATKGLTIVYTGEGKGKTTAALGLALRAAGYKKKVLIYQFGKVWFTGEKAGVKLLKPYLKLVSRGISFVGILDDSSAFGDHLKVMQEAFEEVFQEVKSDKWDLIIIDEIIGAVAGKLVKQGQLVKLIKNKPEKLDLVLTGHHAKSSLYKYVDLVTEMVEIKHPFKKGILAKPGIDY